MKILRVKDKQSDIFRSLFCLSGENTAYLLRIYAPANSYGTNGAPRLFCMRHFEFLARMSQNRGLGRTLHLDTVLLKNLSKMEAYAIISNLNTFKQLIMSNKSKDGIQHNKKKLSNKFVMLNLTEGFRSYSRIKCVVVLCKWFSKTVSSF